VGEARLGAVSLPCSVSFVNRAKNETMVDAKRTSPVSSDSFVYRARSESKAAIHH
jgi:hypothetical protein